MGWTRNMALHSVDYGCPHCAGLPRSYTCCICKQQRKVKWAVIEANCMNVWSKGDCRCDTCKAHRVIEKVFESGKVLKFG